MQDRARQTRDIPSIISLDDKSRLIGLCHPWALRLSTSDMAHFNSEPNFETEPEGLDSLDSMIWREVIGNSTSSSSAPASRVCSLVIYLFSLSTTFIGHWQHYLGRVVQYVGTSTRTAKPRPRSVTVAS